MADLCNDHARGNTPRYTGATRPRSNCPACWKLYADTHEGVKAPAAAGDTVSLETHQKLQTSYERSLRQLADAKDKKAGLIEAVERAATEAAQGLAFKPIPEPKLIATGKPEVAVVMLSDVQLGKVTPTYDSATAEKRVEQYADKVIELTRIQRAAHPVREVHLWFLGDMIEGELIFPGQQFLIDSSLFRQVMIDGPRIFGGFIRRMLAEFEVVKVFGIIGNHGRMGGRASRDYNPENNGDRMLYHFMREIFTASGQDRVEWVIPFEENEKAWFAVDDIGGYRTLLLHGDQLKYGPRAPSTMQKILSWKAGGIGPGNGFDDIAYGHWHQIQRMRYTNTTARINGSTESSNTYAQEFMANMDDPSQWLLFVKPGKGVTAEYQVWLDS